MAALTAERYQTRQDGNIVADPVAAATRIWGGGITVLNAAGNAVPASTATGLIVRGVAQATADNLAGAAGDIKVESRKGVFRFANSAAADLIARAEIGDTAYLVDDQTVAKTDGTGTRSAAGKIEDVDADGVWVRFA